MTIPQNTIKYDQSRLFVIAIVASMLYGTTFLLNGTLIGFFPVFWVIFIRHFIGLLGFLPFLGNLKNVNKAAIKGAVITGTANFWLITLQLFGMQTTDAAVTGFLFHSYILMVPLLSWILFRRIPSRRYWLSLVIAVTENHCIFLNPKCDGYGPCNNTR